MIKSILISVDGSPAASAALEEAVRLAEATGAELRGIFVEDASRFIHYPSGFAAEGGVPIPAPLPAEEMAREKEKAHAEGAAIQAEFEKAVGGRVARHRFIEVQGDVNTLLQVEGQAVDLVVLGRRGRHGPADSHEAGPTTETLLHGAMRPVLVVPGDAQSDGPVVVAFDGSPGALRALVPAAGLAGLLGREVHTLTITGGQENQPQLEYVLRGFFEPHGITPHMHFVPKAGDVPEMVLDFAREQGAGIIAMGAFGKHPLRELFFGSTTLRTLAGATCPVLLMG